MKKQLLIGIAISMGGFAFGQNSSNHISAPKLKAAIANKAVPCKKGQNKDLDTPSFVSVVNGANAHQTPAIGETRVSGGTVIGTSIYDLQTNASVCNRIVLNRDGSISATWTMAHGGDPLSTPNRGTGYNYFNGTTWGTPPTASLESIRCGWPNIGVTAGQGEVIVSHEAASGAGNLHVLTRPAKGTGAWKDTTLGFPDTWPRMAIGGANGKTVHIISQTTGASTPPNPKYHGQNGAIAYSRSLDGGVHWDKIRTVIPQIDSSHYLGFGGDNYAIDARGDTIAIVAGGQDVDVILLKSIDNGTSWTKTIVYRFPIPMYNSADSITDVNHDGVADTIVTNDGSLAILLDKQGKAHVWFGRMRVLCTAAGTGTNQGLSYFPGTDGLNYWNESMATDSAQTIAFALDLNHNGTLDVANWGSYHGSLTSMPSAGIDEAGTIYLSYGSIFEGICDDGTGPGSSTPVPTGKSFRHTYLTRSCDGGQTWHSPIDLVDPDLSQQYDYLEGVFGAMTKRVDHKVHLIYQRDSAPGDGLSLTGTSPTDPQSGTESDIVYVEIAAADHLSCNDTATAGVKENKGTASNVSLYPNPASGLANVIFNLSSAGKVTVKIYNVVGQEVNTFEKELPSGTNTLAVNLADYKPGIYFVKSTIQGKDITKKLIIQ